MKISDFSTEKGNSELCRLSAKTLISCGLENKCDFEISNLKSGESILKSPKTKNNIIRSLKESAAEFFCGK